jgi:preprotein translocase subunit YajC
MIRITMKRQSFSSLAVSTLSLIVTLNGSLWAMAGHSNPDPNAPPPPAWVQWVPMLALFAIFYFLMIRPQAKQRRERETLLTNLKKGDKVVTQSGLVASISSIGPRFVEVKLADDVRVTMLKSSVTEVLPQTAEAELSTLSASR